MKRRLSVLTIGLGTMSALLLTLTLVGHAASPSGAIFTTTPDGDIVNENVHYNSKLEVYLDGGPPPNAPQTSAGLDDGLYVFQVTDPSGKMLLSEDPARCRVIEVENGIITRRVPPTDPSLGKGSDNWAESGPNKNKECHIDDDPPHPTNPGVRGDSGQHDTNVDADHSADGAVVVQLMPYGTTPNPGGVYKAWITPLSTYDDKGDLDDVPKKLGNGQQRPHRCPDFCASADPGFGPPRGDVKTDNFKVKEFFPPEITVRKFNDANGDGIWDQGEPEIGVDQCVLADGTLTDCDTGGGWPYDFTEPLDGGTVTNSFFTPHTHVAGIPGTYTAQEDILSGWTQTAAYLDGAFQGVTDTVNVTVAGDSGEKHEIIFGNTKREKEKINGCLEVSNVPTADPPAVFIIEPTFTNVCDTSLTDIHFEVVTLTGGNVVLNYDGGPAGVGCIVSVPPESLGDDGILSPGESFEQEFQIQLASDGPFDFFVDAYGVVLP